MSDTVFSASAIRSGVDSAGNNLIKRTGTGVDSLIPSKALAPVKAATPTLSSAAKPTVSGADDKFFIKYTDLDGKPRVFTFAMLPAIESNLQISPSGMIRGSGTNVPKVRPGISVTTTMRHKNIPIPGGVPVVQTIGIDVTRLSLVGIFIGSEVDEVGFSRPTVNPIAYDTTRTPKLDNDSYSSSNKADLFRSAVVNQGAKVTVTIRSFNTDSIKPTVEQMVYTGVITNFETHVARRARTYWAMDIIVTDYSVNERTSSDVRVVEVAAPTSTSNILGLSLDASKIVTEINNRQLADGTNIYRNADGNYDVSRAAIAALVDTPSAADLAIANAFAVGLPTTPTVAAPPAPIIQSPTPQQPVKVVLTSIEQRVVNEINRNRRLYIDGVGNFRIRVAATKIGIEVGNLDEAKIIRYLNNQ